MTPIRCPKHEDSKYCMPPYYPPWHCAKCMALYVVAHVAYRVARWAGVEKL